MAKFSTTFGYLFLWRRFKFSVNQAFPRGSRAVTTKKCTIKRDARANCCFNPLLFMRSLQHTKKCLSLYPANPVKDMEVGDAWGAGGGGEGRIWG